MTANEDSGKARQQCGRNVRQADLIADDLGADAVRDRGLGSQRRQRQHGQGGKRLHACDETHQSGELCPPDLCNLDRQRQVGPRRAALLPVAHAIPLQCVLCGAEHPCRLSGQCHQSLLRSMQTRCMAGLAARHVNAKGAERRVIPKGEK